MMENDVVRVYTGSRVEGQFLVELLKENGIGSIYNDRLQSSIDAGWADGSPGDAVQIMVETANAKSAQQFINDYFESRNSK